MLAGGDRPPAQRTYTTVLRQPVHVQQTVRSNLVPVQYVYSYHISYSTSTVLLLSTVRTSTRCGVSTAARVAGVDPPVYGQCTVPYYRILLLFFFYHK